ncbi:MAG TPA: ABC transporter ATP-binding protein [Candidatus Eisenbacteria bacterium]
MRRSGPLRALLAPVIARHRVPLSLATLAMLGAGLAELFKPWPLKLALDLFLVPHRDAAPRLGPFAFLAHVREPVAVAAVAFALLAVTAAGGLCSFAQTLLLSRVAQQSILELRLRLFRHLERLSLAFHRARHSGELLVHLIGDLNVLNDFLVTQASSTLGRVMFLLGMVAVMAWMDPLLTAASLLFVPLLAFAVRRHVRIIREATRAQRRREGRIAAVAGESLQLIPVVQAFGAEEREAARLEREGAAFLAAGLRSSRAEALLQRAVELVAAAGTGLVLYLGVARVRAGSLSTGDLIVFVSYLRGLQRPLRDLAQSAQRYAKASTCARRVVQLLETRPDVVTRPGARRAPLLSGAVSFEHVSFDYGRGRPALADVSFTVEPGERVAVVGETGAGKTTLFALLGRFFDPRSGTVRIDGHDLRELELDGLRAQLSVVLQEAALFGTTIRENLLYGRPGASDAELWAALADAQAQEFVRALPEGLDTPLGERGATLSGGQRQRLAIARAMLRDGRLLLLDEPATGLDPATGRELKRALDRLTRDRTSFVIAHQLETVCAADRILVLDRGHLVGNGRHEEMLASAPVYRRLWESRAFVAAAGDGVAAAADLPAGVGR